MTLFLTRFDTLLGRKCSSHLQSSFSQRHSSIKNAVSRSDMESNSYCTNVSLNVIEAVNYQTKCEKNTYTSILHFVITEWNNLNHVLLLYIFNKYFCLSIENSWWQKPIPWGIKTNMWMSSNYTRVKVWVFLEKSRLGRVIWDVYGQNMSKILCRLCFRRHEIHFL